MVFQDISNFSEPKKNNKRITDARSAHILDRFFSFLIDYLVISPFVLFLLYVSFHDGFAFWKSNPSAPENDTMVVLLGLCYVLYFSLIQALFINFYKATPGQYFLKIRLEFGESDSMLFTRAFFRQIFFWTGFLFLGLPFMAMLTNRQRRTYYDRLSDIFVVTKKDEKSLFDFEIEFKYWQSLLTTLVLFFGFLLTSLIWRGYERVLHRTASFAILENKNYFCEQLRGVSASERLPVAIGLNLSNQLSNECLDKEADFTLWKKIESDTSLAYYAKSLTADDPEKEKMYQSEACAGEDTKKYSSLSSGCKISFSFASGQLEELYVDLKDENYLSESLKYELSLILKHDGDVAQNFAALEKYNEIKSIKKYQITELLNHPGLQRSRSPASLEGGTGNAEVLKLIEDL